MKLFRRPPRPRTALLIAAAALAFAPGCRRGEVRPTLYPARGTLTINGEPAAGAMLVLHPADGQSFDARETRPTAKVGEDGTYHVTTYQEGDGAPTGEYRVSLLWFNNPESSNAWDRLAGRFANPATSKIRVVVQDGKDRLDPIELTGVTVLDRRPPPGGRDADGLQ